jgi:hypothetical protein
VLDSADLKVVGNNTNQNRERKGPGVPRMSPGSPLTKTLLLSHLKCPWLKMSMLAVSAQVKSESLHRIAVNPTSITCWSDGPFPNNLCPSMLIQAQVRCRNSLVNKD